MPDEKSCPTGQCGTEQPADEQKQNLGSMLMLTGAALATYTAAKKPKNAAAYALGALGAVLAGYVLYEQGAAQTVCSPCEFDQAAARANVLRTAAAAAASGCPASPGVTVAVSFDPASGRPTSVNIGGGSEETRQCLSTFINAHIDELAVAPFQGPPRTVEVALEVAPAGR